MWYEVDSVWLYWWLSFWETLILLLLVFVCILIRTIWVGTKSVFASVPQLILINNKALAFSALFSHLSSPSLSFLPSAFPSLSAVSSSLSPEIVSGLLLSATPFQQPAMQQSSGRPCWFWLEGPVMPLCLHLFSGLEAAQEELSLMSKRKINTLLPWHSWIGKKITSDLSSTAQALAVSFLKSTAQHAWAVFLAAERRVKFMREKNRR